MALLAPGDAGAQDESHADEGTELLQSHSRAPYVHRLTLYDHDGAAIDPADDFAGPYSPKMTCSKCHAYAEIASGWHFNEPTTDVANSRPGEPWIFVDEATGTQIPISGRGWPGTFKPQEVGLTNWEFVKRFGAHTPGGGYGEPDQQTIDDSPETLRWGISGKLEIDCMFCHAASQQHDPAEAERQIKRENFRWAPTAAMGFAVIRGDAAKAPDDWDPMMPPNPDYPDQSGPELVWDQRRFDPDDRVFFNITRRPAADRCYFCHSFREVGERAPERFLESEDVHMRAGLTCTDCHRNGLDHKIVRGYEGEAQERNEPELAQFTCQGCHLGVDDAQLRAELRLGGQYGAPRPTHAGLPPLHFEKLTCTACHSGPYPEEAARQIQTALAHGLGLATRDRDDTSEPQIVTPVFARQSDGRTDTQRLLWPALWARVVEQRIRPLPLATVIAAGEKLPEELRPKTPPVLLNGEQIDALLQILVEQGAGDFGNLVYIRDGFFFRRLEGGGLGSMPEPAAAPYVWPLGHNVRPATQALGAGGCTDCHSDGAPFFAGSLASADTRTRPSSVSTMQELRHDDDALLLVWNNGFVFRSAFKWFGFTCAGLIALVLLRFALAVQPTGATAEPSKAPPRGLSPIEHVFHTIATVGLLTNVVTGFGSDWVYGEVGGWWLLVHMLGAPLFILGLTGSALLWGGRFTTRHANGGGFNNGQWLTFWVVLLLGFIVMTSMLAAMLPIFGYAGQELLGEVHEVSALLLLIAMGIHTIVSLAARRARGARK